MNKIFFTIFITIFLSHCGFSPIYVGNPKEIVVSKSEIIGDKNLAFDLERKLNFKVRSLEEYLNLQNENTI